MDSFGERWHNHYRNYRTSGTQHHFDKRHGDYKGRHDNFKGSRIQKQSYKKRNYVSTKKNYRLWPQRKLGIGDTSVKSSNVSQEDAEEEERKKKLSDAANKLLSKIKFWNSENGSLEDAEKSAKNVEESGERTKCGSSGDGESKLKRIAHSKSKKQVKKVSTKNQSLKSTPKSSEYEVNKATVKDFQNRIQHKLINEIMQMPKENLQNVLNDPKINPIMELKMSRLVKENKLLIAQKLRALAESKITSYDSVANSALLVDIDKLIDPVIETDLSALPYELIKQMENIFQVQFDYSNHEVESQTTVTGETNSLPDGEVEAASEIPEGTTEGQFNANEPPTTTTFEPTSTCCSKNANFENLNVNLGEDLSVYECSTDEDEEPSECDVREQISAGENAQNHPSMKRNTRRESGEGGKKRKLFTEIKTDKTKETVSAIRVKDFSRDDQSQNFPLVDRPQAAYYIPSQNKEIEDRLTSYVESPSSGSCSKSAETQTEDRTATLGDLPQEMHEDLSEGRLLYGAPLPQKATSNDPGSLLEEVNSIQNLINKLNERRFMIFLQLAKTNPCGSFMDNKITGDNFVETISNGNIYLVESLMNFFSKTQNSRGNSWTFKDKCKKSKKKKKKQPPNSC